MPAAHFAILHPHRRMSLVFPSAIDGMVDILPLIRAEKAEVEAVLGVAVDIVEQTPASGPRWLVEIDPDAPHNALSFDRSTLTLVSRVRDIDGFSTSLNLLHSLAGLGVDVISDAPHPTLVEASHRIAQEVAGTFPGFGIRDLEWDAICARHGLPRDESLTVGDLERWIADLGDAHTAVRRTGGTCNPPYVVHLDATAATLHRVPEWSAAHAAGVRAGWTLDGIDGAGWLSHTGAPPHAKPWTAGRRAIALNGVTERTFTALSPDGERVTWTERAEPPAREHLVSWERLDPRTGYLRLANWLTGYDVEDAFDAALFAFSDCDRLILDLQGNTGGNLMLATRTRNRFLRERALIGTIRFSTGEGHLAAPVELWADPEPERIRWDGDLIVLTDPLTYSASEDFLLGLQGLPHVTVIGQRSGGGSGRARTIALTEDVSLTISTALTFDRAGGCVENHGVPVDIETTVFALVGNPALDCAVEWARDRR